MQNLTRLSGRLLLLAAVMLAHIQAVIGQTTTTKSLRTQINNTLPSNTARSITAEKLRAVFLSSANAIDSIYTTISQANTVGEYDASTGIATISATDSTITPDTVAAFADGKYFDVVKPGNRTITGAAVDMQVGGKIIARGGRWGYIPPSDLALSKTAYLENKLPYKNLANPLEFIDGGFINGATGAYGASAGYGYTGFIEVTPGLPYTGKGASSNGMRHLAFYNAARAFVAGGYSANVTTFTVPAGVKYVIASYYAADKSTFQFEQGDTPTSPVPYGTAILSNTLVNPSAVATTATSRFISDAERITWNKKLDQAQVVLDTVLTTKNLFRPSNVVTGAQNVVQTTNGAFLTIAGWIRTGPIKCKPNTTYTISGLVTRNSKAVRYEDAAGVFISYTPPPSPATGTTMTFTTPAGAAKMYINLQRVEETVTLSAIQVEESATATTLVPYGETVTLKTLMGHVLSKLDVGLTNVNNTADTDKPVSTAQLAAINSKVDTTAVSWTLTGKSKNLADIDGFTDGGYIENTGAVVTNAAYGYTGFIEVTPFQTYSGYDGTNGMRKTCFFDANKTQVAGGSTNAVTTFTVPAGVKWVRVSYYIGGKNTFQFEQGPAPTFFSKYASGTKALTAVFGAPVMQNALNAKRTITLADCERILLVGDSYSVGYNALPGKSYISALSMFSDWNLDNYSKSGDATNMILARLLANSAQYKGVVPTRLKGGGYAVIISFTNDVNQSVINSTAQLNTYLANIRLLAEALKGLGYKPVIATEYHASTGTNGTGLVQAALSQFCEENGYIFMDVYEKTRYLKGATNFANYWEGSHPGTRTNAIFWTNMLPYVNALPRPRWGIKIYRKRDLVSVATVADLMYTGATDRAKKFKEILVTGQAMSAATYNKYDDQANWTSASNVVSVSEYYDLMNGSTIAMGDYSLMEVTVNTTPEKISRLDIKVGAVDAVYVKNNISQTWTPLTVTGGVVSLTDFASQINFDKASLLIVKAGGWNMLAPQIDFYGVEGKTYYQKPAPREFRTGELVTTRNFNAGTSGWTVAGTITPAAPEDSGSMPTGITKVATISTGNDVAQTVNFAAATYKRRAQLKIIARRNPPRYDSANEFPVNSPITLDSYDFANVRANVTKGANTITMKQVVGMHWTEAIFEFDVAAGDTSYTIGIQKDDQDFELADLSLKIE
ncbi:SGNH/GDSL hydrolase family protein [Dyadobacter sp. OTU695]|uniref:SGNH/GDSL hydrolase family protein n=1 Tax=Dyadobacter sp. OTU695 TaxID=3043860 RepID=UPI00313B8887